MLLLDTGAVTICSRFCLRFSCLAPGIGVITKLDVAHLVHQASEHLLVPPATLGLNA
jgi:hypothetical protein